MSVDVFYAFLTRRYSEKYFSELLKQVPKIFREDITKYIREEDRLTHLIGKILLTNAIKRYNLPLDIEYTCFGRPFIRNYPNTDFNISHSKDLVACVITENTRIGIDVEYKKEIEISDYKMVFTTDEWNSIITSNNPTLSFYENWSKKECIAKAEGIGLNLDFKKIILKGNPICIKNTFWYITDLKISDNYTSFIASDKQLEHVNFHQYFF